MSEIDEIITQLSDTEKKILSTIGRINASPNKNFTRQTLKKKSTDKEEPHVDASIKKFKNLRLLRVYRAPDNFAATSLGFKVAQKLREQSIKTKYNGIRIIRR